MKYLHFGRRTGLRVSELALGTGNFGTGWGYGSERGEAKDVFGDFISADRDYFVLATKYTLGLSPADGVTRTGNNRKNLIRSVEETEKGDREIATLDAVLAIAQELDATASHVAIAWLLDKARKSSTALVPILGSRTRAQLDATLGAVSLHLSAEQVQRLDQASAIVMGNPYDIVAQNAASIAGGSAEALRKPLIPPR